MVFLVATREQGDLGDANSGGMGRAELIGGTGKYANITGQCSYGTRYLSASAGVTSHDCAWSQPWGQDPLKCGEFPFLVRRW